MVNNLYLGCIDLLILSILIIVNIVIYLKFRNKEFGCIVILGIALLYIIILPLISQIIEVWRVVDIDINGADDSFTLLYTYLRFPIYWILGFIQLLILAIFYKSNFKK